MGDKDGSGSEGKKKSSRRTSPSSTPKSAHSPESGHGEANTNLASEQNQGLLHGDAQIDPGGSDDEDEFSASSVTLSDTASFQTTINDEGVGEDGGESDASTSVYSSLFEHSYENGRRYHRYRHGRYPIPNDEEEQNREDLLHTMMLEATDGRLYYAPLEEDRVQKIIDLGTGTGSWAMDMGERLPQADIMGLDLSPIQPAWVPPNVKFYIDDVEEDWLNGDDFDFVHLRNMVPILKDPVKLLRQAYEHMRPGAWVELQDVDGDVHTDDNSVPEDWPLKLFTQYLLEAFAKFETNAHAAVFGGQYLHDAGFVNIRHNYIKLPYGTWPKDKVMRLVGMYYAKACEEFFPAVGAMHFPLLGWSRPEIEVFFAQCRKSMRDPSVHAYGKMHFWSGQKPLEDPSGD